MFRRVSPWPEFHCAAVHGGEKEAREGRHRAVFFVWGSCVEHLFADLGFSVFDPTVC